VDAPRKILTIVGTRPEAIKMAPVIEELRRYPDRFESVIVSTGQHRELLDQALDAFGLKPDIELSLMEPNQSLSGYAAKALSSLADVILRARPSAVLVQGDTTTVAMAALAAFYNGVFVGHVEAGLRSFDRDDPFPEEMNRELAGLVADLHFVPTEQARLNLLRTGVAPGDVLNTGNTIIDALQSMTARKTKFDDPRLAELAELAGRGRLLVVTAHRRESFGEPLREVCRALVDIIREAPDLHVVLPVHPNPAVSDIVKIELRDAERISVIPAVGYSDMLLLMKSAWLVLSDSGGIQEEAPSLNVPLLVLRNVTERPEVIETGAAKLVGTSRVTIVDEVRRLLADKRAYSAMRGAPNPFGDGQAARRIVDALALRLRAVPQAWNDDGRQSARRSAERAARIVIGALALTVAPAAATAQANDGFVEAGASSHHMSAGLGSMQQEYLRVVYRARTRDLWNGEIVREREFGDRGVFFGLTNTHTINDLWYTTASAGTSAGGFFFPRFRAGLTIARKWPQVRGLVTTAGAGYFAWKDAHRDAQLSAGALYYFTIPLVAEAGVSWNRSSPGSVVSRYQYVAVTQGQSRRRYLTLRVAGGREAYQLIAPSRPIADFRSGGVAAGVRQWITPRWGVAATAERYSNPSYLRRGLTLGAFYQME